MFFFYLKGKYDTATEYSKQAFDCSRQMNHRESTEYNRVLFGITKAHKNLKNFNDNVEFATRKTINNLIKWKYDTERENVLSDKVSKDSE